MDQKIKGLYPNYFNLKKQGYKQINQAGMTVLVKGESYYMRCGQCGLFFGFEESDIDDSGKVYLNCSHCKNRGYHNVAFVKSIPMGKQAIPNTKTDIWGNTVIRGTPQGGIVPPNISNSNVY